MENHIKILIKKGLVFLLFFIFITLLINLRLTLRFKNYSLLDRCVTNSFIINSIIFNKGNMYVNDSIQFATSYKNDTPPPVLLLDEFIQKGDSISLKANSDTLYVYRGGKKHWFIYYGEPCDK